MNKEELVRNLKYAEKKHRHDTVNTFDTDILMMCSDVLGVLKNCIEIPKGATNGDAFEVLFPNCKAEPHKFMNMPCGVDVKIYIDKYIYFKMWVPASWWNAPYKTEKCHKEV